MQRSHPELASKVQGNPSSQTESTFSCCVQWFIKLLVDLKPTFKAVTMAGSRSPGSQGLARAEVENMEV